MGGSLDTTPFNRKEVEDVWEEGAEVSRFYMGTGEWEVAAVPGWNSLGAFVWGAWGDMNTFVRRLFN